MERLTERSYTGVAIYKNASREPDKWQRNRKEVLQKLADYEDAEEQGLLLQLPCKVGTYIYIVNHYWIDEGNICGIAECDDVDCACFKVYEDPDTYTMVAFDEFGVTWFLTQEEAEQALKRLESET